MGKRNLTNERLLCRQTFVNYGLTEFKVLEAMHGVDRRTIAKWADEENWLGQREKAIITPESVAMKVAKVLAREVEAVEEQQLEGVHPTPAQMKRLLDYTKALRELDQEYDVRGSVIRFGELFINYVDKLQGERDLLKALQRVMPGFFTYVEQGNGRVNR